jgi:MGT family glycosyltransferase
VTLLVISPDYASHAVPLLTLSQAWRARGEAVVVATGSAVAPLVERAGAQHVQIALGPGSNAGIARPEDQPAGEDVSLLGFFDATRRGMLATLRYQTEARARDLLWQPVEVARRTLEIVAAVRPDTILVDHLAFGATLALRAAGIEYADVVLGHPRQLPVAGETYGVPGAWPAAVVVDPSGLDDLVAASRGVADAFTGAYNDALRSVSPDAEPVPDAFAAHGPVVLFNYPERLHDLRRTADLPAARAFLGATPRHERPSPETARWLAQDSSRPLVLVSLGTFLSARDDVLIMIAEGLRGLSVRVALATGSTDPDRLGPLPDAWLVAPYLDQVSLLEHAGALVTHAGNNSVTEALAHGVPMLALPFSTDQFDGAAAIEASGVGLAGDPNTMTPPELATAVDRLLETEHPGLDSLAASLARRSGASIAHAAVGEWLGPVSAERAARAAGPR